MSQKTVISPKATRKNAPDHLVPVASPRQIPATQSQGRQPSQGPNVIGSRRVLAPCRVLATASPLSATCSAPTLRARTSREWSRSMSRAQNAANAQNITMRSSRPVREWTKCWPSNARRMAAIVPSSADPNIRRAARPIIRIERVPSRATENRHPNELVAPKRCSPTAMIHLPTGGWTTRSPSVPKTFVVPWVNSTSGLLMLEGTRLSWPYLSIETPCLT